MKKHQVVYNSGPDGVRVRDAQLLWRLVNGIEFYTIVTTRGNFTKIATSRIETLLAYSNLVVMRAVARTAGDIEQYFS